MQSVHHDTNRETNEIGPSGSCWHILRYEETSNAYRVYDVEARQVVITRDVNFNESTVGISVVKPSEEVDDTTSDFDLFEITEDDVHQVDWTAQGSTKKQQRTFHSASSCVRRSKCAGQLLCSSPETSIEYSRIIKSR